MTMRLDCKKQVVVGEKRPQTLSVKRQLHTIDGSINQDNLKLFVLFVILVMMTMIMVMTLMMLMVMMTING